ncbi:hypothetical protein CEXT_209091 [Caerostris extrusa]|uniref:Uncharacterized protein n=1 Tax=Caerostris extrusa TaxID=172846 RepID=A0AAV4MFG0_CAEEX|nr:hypothetical protein CEXT_209091 [Caerostris extrusa]
MTKFSGSICVPQTKKRIPPLNASRKPIRVADGRHSHVIRVLENIVWREKRKMVVTAVPNELAPEENAPHFRQGGTSEFTREEIFI